MLVELARNEHLSVLGKRLQGRVSLRTSEGVTRGVWAAGCSWPLGTAGDASPTGEGLEKTARSSVPDKERNLPPALSAVPPPD